MDKGTNVLAVNFAMQLVQMYLVDERYNTVVTVTESDLYHTVSSITLFMKSTILYSAAII